MKKHQKSSESIQSRYLAAGRAVILAGGEQQNSNGDKHSEFRPIADQDPNAPTLGNDIALKSVTFESAGFDEIKQWRDKLFTEMPEITDELPRLLTEYMRQSEGDSDSPYLSRAKAL